MGVESKKDQLQTGYVGPGCNSVAERWPRSYTNPRFVPNTARSGKQICRMRDKTEEPMWREL